MDQYLGFKFSEKEEQDLVGAQLEPFGQRLLVISTTLSASHVGSLHIAASALYKYPATRCKNQLERSTRPNNVFMETEFSGMSTGKNQFREHYAGLGFNGNYVNGVVPFLSIGVNCIDAERRKLEFSEYAPSAHVGFKYTPISFLTFTPSYRYRDCYFVSLENRSS